MEIKIKNAVLRKTQFLVAVERLLQSRSMPARTCIEINRLIDEVATHLEILNKARRDVTLRYCVRDEKNGIKVIDNKVVFPNDDAREACAKELEDLDNEFFTAELTEPVTIYDDETITPIDLRLMGHVVQVKERPKPEGT